MALLPVRLSGRGKDDGHAATVDKVTTMETPSGSKGETGVGVGSVTPDPDRGGEGGVDRGEGSGVVGWGRRDRDRARSRSWGRRGGMGVVLGFGLGEGAKQEGRVGHFGRVGRMGGMGQGPWEPRGFPFFCFVFTFYLILFYS